MILNIFKRDGAMQPMTRRMFAVQLAAGVVGVSFRGITLAASGGDGLSFDAESIHQEIAIAASPTRIYTALTDARQFTTLMALSGMKGVRPAEIGRGEGAPFSLFGGVIVGRNVEARARTPHRAGVA
jgi:hypothetical protein